MNKCCIGKFILLALSLGAGASFAGPLDKAWIRGTTDKDPFGYACGEKMTLTLTVMDATEPIPAGAWFLSWKRSGDDGLVEEGRAPAEKPFVFEAKIDKPGFVRLQAWIVDAAGKRFSKPYTGDTTTPEGKAAMNEYEKSPHHIFFDGGAGADTATLKTVEPPADLAEYWKTFDERLAKIPIRADRVLVSTDRAGYRIYAVSVTCAGIFPVTGYLSVPPDASAEKRYPARLTTHGYGGAVRWHNSPKSHPCNGEIVLDINPFGQKLPAFGGTEADRLALWWAVHDGKQWSHAFSPDQNADRDTAFFNGMVLRVKRGLQYLKTLPEWNGKDLYASGGSQGGLQTIWAAACGEGVTRAMSSITWCCDMYTSGKLRKDKSLKLSSDGWYIGWTPAMNYYDAAIVATLIPPTCTVIVPRAGLGDYCCPPTGLVKLYHALACPKEFHWMQGSTHGYCPPAYEGRDIVWKAPAAK